jgi:intracellular sulfur oxidation DsrE/DsrF family protein
MIRLEALSPDLAVKLRRASTDKQRAACLAACEFAVAHTKVDHPLVVKALKKVRAAGVFTAKERADMDALVGSGVNVWRCVASLARKIYKPVIPRLSL